MESLPDDTDADQEQLPETAVDASNSADMASSNPQTSAPPTRQKDGQPLEPLPEVSSIYTFSPSSALHCIHMKSPNKS
mgnify:CR=1